MVVEGPVVAPRRLEPGCARREHLDRLVVDPVQHGAVEHVADDRSAAVTVGRESAVAGERDAEGDDGFAGGVGQFVLVEELTGREGATVTGAQGQRVGLADGLASVVGALTGRSYLAL